MMHTLPQRVRVIRIVNRSSSALPQLTEYAYYALVSYGIMGAAWGQSVPLLGAGMVAVLACYCVMRLGPRLLTVYAPLALPLGCAIFYIIVQLAVHNENRESVYSFIIWILTLMIVQALSLRQGFLHRFACAAFIIGLTTLPYLRTGLNKTSGVVRMDLDRTSSISTLANANALAAWFGFCCVYFTIVGLETKRVAVRVTSWLAAVGCLYVIGLTVSRGALFTSAIAIIIALRRLLKHGFVPLLVIIILGWVMYESGLFKGAAMFYTERGLEDTGRLSVWPLVIERFLSSPFVGVGVSNIGTYIPGKSRLITPHNNFLFLALASGVVPLVFFLGYWMRTAQRVFCTYAEQVPDASFRIPLFIYAFLMAQQSNTTFMYPWMIVILCVVSGTPRRLHWMKRRGTVAARATDDLSAGGAFPDNTIGIAG